MMKFQSVLKSPRQWCGLLGMILLPTLVGCGGTTGTIEGSVSLDGQPVRGVEVVYRDLAEGVEGAGITNAEGKYRVFFGRGNRELPVGEYRVTLELMLPEEEAAPAQRQLRSIVSRYNGNLPNETIVPGVNVVDLQLDSKDPT